MNERKVANLVVAAALLVPGSRELAAQIVSKIEAGQYTVSDGVLPMSALRVAPTVQFELPACVVQGARLRVPLRTSAPTRRRHRLRHVHVAHRLRRSRRDDRQREPRDRRSLARQRPGRRADARPRALPPARRRLVRRRRRPAVARRRRLVGRRHRRRRVGQARRRDASKLGIATLHRDVHEFLIHQGRVGPRQRERIALVRQRRIAGDRRRASPMRALFTETAGAGACERQSRFGDLEGVAALGPRRARADGADGPPLRRFVRRHGRLASLDRRRRQRSGSTIASRSSAAADVNRRFRFVDFRRAASAWPGSSSPIGRSPRTRFRCRSRTCRW